MSLTSLLMRTVGVSFNAYVTRTLGAEGTGLFTLVMSVYTLAVTFAASGVNLAATRMTAEAMSRGSVRPVMKMCVKYSLTTGGTAGVLLFVLSGVIGEAWLADSDTVLSLRVLSVSLPFIALSSALSGYFNAVRRVAKNALSQISEQFFKITLTSLALARLVPFGRKYACAAVVGGACIAEALSCVVAGVMYFFDIKKNYPKKGEQKLKRHESGSITGELLGITIPVALTAYVRSGLLTLEHILIPRGLRKNGSSYSASLASYGALSGMAFPVVLYPSAVLNAFSGLLIPELAEAKEKKDKITISKIAERMIRVALVFAVGCAGIMTCMSGELGSVVYSNDEASRFISVFAPLIPVMYLDMTVDAMLKGLGEQVYSMKVNIIDASLSVIFVWLLVPVCGINGYVITVFVCEAVNASLSVARLSRIIGFKLKIRYFLLPTAAIIGSLAFVCTVRRMVFPDSYGIAALTVSIISASSVYLGLLFMMKCIRPEDFGFGSKKTVKPQYINDRRNAA